VFPTICLQDCTFIIYIRQFDFFSLKTNSLWFYSLHHPPPPPPIASWKTLLLMILCRIILKIYIIDSTEKTWNHVKKRFFYVPWQHDDRKCHRSPSNRRSWSSWAWAWSSHIILISNNWLEVVPPVQFSSVQSSPANTCTCRKMRPRRRVSVCFPYHHLNERKTFSKEFGIAFGLDDDDYDDGGDTSTTVLLLVLQFKEEFSFSLCSFCCSSPFWWPCWWYTYT
jgi:hypothetical protein